MEEGDNSKIIEDINIYKRTKFLGNGNYGEVYLVSKGSKKFALKELIGVELKDYSREVSTLSKLKFPSVLGLEGYTLPQNDDAYIVTEYVPNGDLTKVIKAEFKINNYKGSVPKEWTITKKLIVLYGIAKGMAYVHSQDVMHRDLKPDNILLDENYEPKIADFGLSKLANSDIVTQHTMQIGTLLYEAPEVMESGCYDKKVDVYSFAIIACYMFKGKVPFQDEKSTHVIAQLTSGVRDEKILEGLPEIIHILIEVAWSHEPEQRPSFEKIVEILANPDVYNDIEGIDVDAYLEYVNRLENYDPNEIQEDEDSTPVTEEVEDVTSSEQVPPENPQTTETPPSLQIDATPDFEILKQIGSGEFCQVYLVREKSDEYAMKQISKYDPKAFLLEMKSLAQLDFPSILGVKWFGLPYKEKSKPALLSCDFVPNGELEEMIQKEKDQKAPQEWNVTKKMIALYGIAKGMEYCHQNNVVHYNLNTENIMLNSNYEPVIIDLELEKFAEIIVEGYGSCLSKSVPFFTAPEKIAEYALNEKIDIYSFGVIVYYLLAGRHPFENLNMINFISRVTGGQRDQIPDEIPQNYHKLIQDCWDDSPGLRPSFREIVTFLSQPQNYLPGVNASEYEEYMNRINSYSSNNHHENIETVMKKYMRTSPTEKVTDSEISDIMSHMLRCNVESLLKKGKDYEESNKMKKAAQCYLQVSQVDDPRGQLNYGRLLSAGNGVKRSSLQASYYLRLASQSFDKYPDIALEALLMLGSTYEEMGEYKKALDSYEEAMKRGSAVGQTNYAKLLGDESIPDIQHDLTKSLSLLNELADKKDGFALCTLGKLYMEGKNGVSKDEKKGIELLHESADLDCPEGQYEYGNCLLNGIGIEKDYKSARSYIEKSSSKNNLDAYYALARIYKEGLGVKKDFSTAVTLLESAATSGLIRAGYQAGMYYLDKEKFKSALKAFKSASQSGDPDASFQYAMLLKDGKGVSDKKPDVERAAAIFKELADSLGNTQAMRELGLIHLNKLMKYTNSKLAVHYLKNGADRGDAVSQFNYAKMLENGEIVQKDIIKAKHYYKLAADQGNDEAKTRLQSIDSK